MASINASSLCPPANAFGLAAPRARVTWWRAGRVTPRTSNAVLHTVLPASYPQLISNPVLGLLDSNGASTHTVPSNHRQSALSADGRFVAFTSFASNLVAGDTNAVVGVFVKDLSDGSVVRAALKSDGTEDTTSNNFAVDLAPSLSADGRFIAFMTAGRLSPLDTRVHNDIYVRDLQTGALDIVSSNSQDVLGDFRSASPASISADGRYMAFASQAFNFAPNDVNDTADIWRKDRVTRQIANVYVANLVSSNVTIIEDASLSTSDANLATSLRQPITVALRFWITPPAARQAILATRKPR